MRKMSGLIVLISIISSCRLNGSSEKYFIEGTIKNNPAKTVMLEKLSLQQITVVDSGVINDKGFFKLEGVSEKGLYRLKFDDKPFFLFLLEPAKYSFDIDAQHPEVYRVTGP